MKTPKALWYVVDHAEKLLSWDAQGERGDEFGTFKAAQRRAVELSQTEPGRLFVVCQATHFVSAAVGPSVTAKIGAV